MVVAVVIFGILFSMPNLYRPDPALQISPASGRLQITEELISRVDAIFIAESLAVDGIEQTENSLIIRLQDGTDQLRAKTLLDRELGREWVVALDEASTVPAFFTALGARSINLGLDLKGGVHFLMEVDMPRYLQSRVDDYGVSIQNSLRTERIGFRQVTVADDSSILVLFRDDAARQQGDTYLRREFPELTRSNISGELPGIELRVSADEAQRLQDYAVSQNLTTLNNRINALGVAEPSIIRQGANRIVVQLPGIQDPAQAKRIIGSSANLEFRMQARAGAASSEYLTFPYRDNPNNQANLSREVIITGDAVTNAQPGFDENGRAQVSISLNSAGGSRMHQVTRNAVGQQMGTLFIENITRSELRQVDGKWVEELVREEVREIISLATVQSALGNSFRITGVGTYNDAAELALLLRAGALAAPMFFVEERTIGPSLGKENIDRGINSLLLGMVLVMLFMLAYYKVFGLFANLALLVNLVLIVALMSSIGAVLTLPGIAGIVLTVGMAVDANVLIFTRIKEELKSGTPVQSSIKAGYDRAFITILDSNLTTLIVAVILFAIGTGPVRGFAVTLSFGIITSMFTALVGTRALVNLIYGRRALDKLPI